jgi:hypothetical protein
MLYPALIPQRALRALGNALGYRCAGHAALRCFLSKYFHLIKSEVCAL